MKRKQTDKDRERSRAYHAAHRDELNAKHRARNANGGWERWKETNHRARLRREFGITPEIVAATLTAQGGACAICCSVFTKTPHIDHDHETGRFRGLLCASCNRGLGMLKDNQTILLRAAGYVEKAQERFLGAEPMGPDDVETLN